MNLNVLVVTLAGRGRDKECGVPAQGGAAAGLDTAGKWRLETASEAVAAQWWGGGRRQDIILIFIRHVQTPLNNKTKGGSDSPLIHVLSNSQQQAGVIIISCLAALIKSDKFSDMLIQNVISNYKLNGCCDSRCHPQYQSHSLQLLLVVILQSFSSCFVS